MKQLETIIGILIDLNFRLPTPSPVDPVATQRFSQQEVSAGAARTILTDNQRTEREPFFSPFHPIVPSSILPPLPPFPPLPVVPTNYREAQEETKKAEDNLNKVRGDIARHQVRHLDVARSRIDQSLKSLKLAIDRLPLRSSTYFQSLNHLETQEMKLKVELEKEAVAARAVEAIREKNLKRGWNVETGIVVMELVDLLEIERVKKGDYIANHPAKRRRGQVESETETE